MSSNISKSNVSLQKFTEESTHCDREKWRNLNLQFSHSPNNLKLGTQRILFCLEHDLTEFLAGALQDLFVSLEDSGWSLRHRMYNLCSPLLQYTERKYFQKWLADSTDTEIEYISFSGSVLMSQSVSRVNDDLNKNNIDEIQLLAHELIEKGKLAKAQRLLEETCLNNHKLKPINQELQQFYFYSENKNALSGFILTLQGAKKKPLKSWLELQEKSKSWQA
ncbi:MAG: hypothetical protein V3U71_10835 [Cocleimonas sp.]